MRTLVAGRAALYDLLGRAGLESVDGSIGLLVDGPALEGRWLPGGAAPTVALAFAAAGQPVVLWHPLPPEAADATHGRLRAAGIDIARTPEVRDVGRCILIRGDLGVTAWSAVPSGGAPPASLFEGVEQVVLTPRWGSWADELAAEAQARGLPCSIIGMAPPARSTLRWQVVVVSDHQLDRAGAASIEAEVLAITAGPAGADIRVGSHWSHVAAAAATVVDPTGAGDVFGGTFLAALSQGRPVPDAAEAAAAAAARCCEAWGAQTALLRSLAKAVPPARTATDRARGALWGLACGDAFGMPASFLPATATHALWPTGLTAMVPAPDSSPYHAGYPAGRVTDDTEQGEALSRALRRSPGALEPELVAQELDAWFEHVGGAASLAVGPSTRRGLLAWRDGTPATESGRGGASNGAAMRLAPLGVLHGLLGSTPEELLADVTAACLPTHNSRPAIAAAAAVAGAVAAGVRGAPWPAVLAAGREHATAASAAPWICSADVSERIGLAVELATGASTDAAACEQMARVIGTGEPSAEAVPAAFGLAARAEGDPGRAILLAANTEGDTDTIGAMAGAIAGAWGGEARIPAAWRDLVGRVNHLDVAAWCADLVAVADRSRQRGGQPT